MSKVYAEFHKSFHSYCEMIQGVFYPVKYVKMFHLKDVRLMRYIWGYMD